MTALTALGLQKSYGTKAVLEDATLTVDQGERVGVVGRNGAGKSTFARILAGLETADGGEIRTRRGLTVGYLAQAPSFEAGETALGAVLAGRGGWRQAMDDHERATSALADAAPESDDQHQWLQAQAEAAARVEEHGGWDLTHEAAAVLDHVGILDLDRDVASMSGGEKRRVALARLLVARPDLAILDEPTNHLDVDTIDWLERYLETTFKGALLLVTHDRYLLDRLVTRTVEVADGRLHVYQGGWGEYLEAKAEREAHAARAEANRQNFLRRELEWLRRQPKARSTKQKARVERAEAAIDQLAPKREDTAKLAMTGTRAGSTVLEVEHLGLTLGDRRLIEDLTLRLAKGERIGVVGPNGSGKTSFLRVLLGELEPTQGHVTVGRNTKIAYLDQHRSGLDPSHTVREAAAGNRATAQVGNQELEAAVYLERFLFDRHAQRQRVSTLSGGEKARVALARALMDAANLVILDEPTNDLDVETLGALEESLVDFPGTSLIVTHDRFLLDRVATSILGFDGRGDVVRVHGTYADYRAWRKEQAATKGADKGSEPESRPVSAAVPTPAPAKSPGKKLTYAERIELDGLDEKIAAAEAAVARLETAVADPSFYERAVDEQQAAFAELETAKATADTLVERWADLSERA